MAVRSIVQGIYRQVLRIHQALGSATQAILHVKSLHNRTAAAGNAVVADSILVGLCLNQVEHTTLVSVFANNLWSASSTVYLRML
jgi:hypothetical protein